MKVRGWAVERWYLRLGRARRRAILLAILLSWGFFTMLSQPKYVWLQAKGPPIPGHANLECQSCHRKASGSLRQQLEGAAQYLLSFRKEPVFIGSRPVQNSDCLECHDRPLDRHPVERFSESRFARARKDHGVTRCTGCHSEHSGVRVTAPGGICASCHQDLDLEGDRIRPNHAELISSNQWETCLQCHDFHGNHRGQEFAELPGTLHEAHTLKTVQDYLGSGSSLYGEILYPAKKEPNR